MSEEKRDKDGYIILEENVDAMIADVLRMKAGTSKFQKRYGKTTQTVAGNAAKAYQQTKDKPFKDKLLKFLGSVAEIVVPALLSRISGLDLTVSKGSGFSFTTFFK